MLTPSAMVCVIGFGEAGSALASGLAQRGYAVRAWDVQLEDPAVGNVMRAQIENSLVDPAPSMADAMRGAKLVVCAVPATDERVRRDLAGLLVTGQVFMDLQTMSVAAQVEALGFAYDPVARQISHRGELP